MSVHIGSLSSMIISHVRYGSIIIIIDVHSVIFHNVTLIVLDLNTINDISVTPPCWRHATRSYKHAMIVVSTLWPKFIDKIRGGGVESGTNFDPVRCSVLSAFYWLCYFLDTRTDWNSTPLSFCLCNHFLVLCNRFLLT